MTETVTIATLGAGGDGVAETREGRVFVPYTLPGEVAEIEQQGNRARLIRLLESSPDRVAPLSPHYGICGGCQVQHLAAPAYLAWKREIVVKSLALHGIAAVVEPIVPVLPGKRRRAIFSAVNAAGGIVLGFHQRASETVVPIADCPVLLPSIENRLALLREIAGAAVRTRHRARIAVLAADNGLDVAISGGGDLGAGQIARLGQLAAGSLARLTVDGVTAFLDRTPEIAAGEAILLPPPGGFVQAVASAEAAMAAAMLAHLGAAGPVADLFAGIGTFSLRLAATAPVTAVEGDAELLGALGNAARRARGLKQIQSTRRDLFVNPLAPNELDRFAAVVFDPPAAGAKRQSEMLARSKVKRVVAVSCNPATLARDARILIDGGYTLTRVLPVDQFLWSAQIEVVACFSR